MIVALHSQYPSFRSIGPVSPCARFAPSTKHSRVHCFSTSFLQHSIILVLLLLAFYASRLSFFPHLTWLKGPRIVCVLLAGPSPHSLNRLDAYFDPPRLHTRNTMAAPNEPPRRVSMAYVLGFSKTPFKDPKPPPPPPQLRRPSGVGELVSELDHPFASRSGI
jgi:hypothetical protein